jgi:N-acylglucosamine-6-phosphate 2-epimerase
MTHLPASLATLHRGLIVSCQAPVDSPLHDPTVIAAMAQAAINQGAAGVRIDTPTHVEAVCSRIEAPVIGLWKRQIPGYDVYITPGFWAAQRIAQGGAQIIAVDGTARDRPHGETLPNLIERIHQELGKPVLADVDTLENALYAAAAGADAVSTTLYGYTRESKLFQPPGFSLLEKMVAQLQIPVICEGGIASPVMAQRAIALGAYAVVVGTAITGIDIQVQRYQAALVQLD